MHRLRCIAPDTFQPGVLVPYRAVMLLVVVAAGIACTRSSNSSQPSAVPAPAPAPASNEPQLMTGLAGHHHTIATGSKEAQAFFDQGFTLVYAFNHDEAVRSFQRAAALDPKAAMPYWGIAWAVGPNYNLDIDDPRAKQAYEAIERAKALAGSAPSVERDYIEALSVRYSANPKADRVALAQQYSKAMGDLMRRYPDDLDAATLYAESLMNLRPWKLW